MICVISLFLSSIVQNLHWLLLTYSLPYGFANAAIFILGTLVCGLYYPAGQHPKHILVMCIISTGFPIGYHIMSAFVFSSIEDNGWQSMKRRVAMVELIVTCVLGPFFTTKCLPNPSEEYQYPSNLQISDNNQRKIYYSKPIIYWMLGIFSAMCAINNFLLHMVCFTDKRKEKCVKQLY
jgi:MFS family permease